MIILGSEHVIRKEVLDVMVTVGDYFLRAVHLRLDHPAVVHQDEALSYAELETRSRGFAQQLSDHGVQPGNAVLVELDPVPQAIVSVIACSLIRAVYVPVSPHAPPARRRSIEEACRPVVRVVEDGKIVTTERAGNRLDIAYPDLAYLIFTSGTTGRPKGIAMTHRAAIAFFTGMAQQLHTSPDERVGSFAPMNFDFSLLNLGMALGAGATLVQIPHILTRHPQRLVAYLDRQGVTRVSGVPSIWLPVLEHVRTDFAALGSLRSLVLGGEPYTVGLLRELHGAQPLLRLINVFGQSESIACSFLGLASPLPENLQRVPIGPAHPGARMLVLTENGCEAGPGETGELYLRSPALFSGYWRDSEATDQALVTLPRYGGERILRTRDRLRVEPDGTYTFAGRADLQVKIQGNRVELEEVETCLLRHSSVKEVLVTAVNHARGTQLVALVISADRMLPRTLRAHCGTLLPPYMVPSVITSVASLPRNGSGKLDRVAAHEIAAQIVQGEVHAEKR